MEVRGSDFPATGECRDVFRLHAATDPHSPPKYRINGVVVNMPEFARAFSCKADAAMVKPVEKVCRIW